MAETPTTSATPESFNYLSYVLAMYDKNGEGEYTYPDLWDGKYPNGVLPF